MSNQDRERFDVWFVTYADPNVGYVETGIQRHAALAGWQAALSAGQATEPVACSVQLQLDDAILAQGEIGRLKTVVREHEETIRQLVRALREATEGETFMGEPVLRAAGQVIPEPPTADALDAKRYRFLRDQYEGRSYTTDSGPRPSTPESRVAYAIKNFGERTLGMIEIHLLCHHLGPREEPFWTPGDHFDYGRNMDAALDAAMLLAAPTLGDQG